MATIETNDAEAVGVTTEEIIEQLMPMIRARPAIIGEGEPLGLGWLRDLPDFRDYTPESDTIKPQLEEIGAADAEAVSIPATVDLRQYCSPIEEPGLAGLVHRERRRRARRVLRASGTRALHRRVPAVPLQSDP